MKFVKDVVYVYIQIKVDSILRKNKCAILLSLGLNDNNNKQWTPYKSGKGDLISRPNARGTTYRGYQEPYIVKNH